MSELLTNQEEVLLQVADFKKLAHKLGSAFFYGDMKVETPNERDICEILERHGFLYKNEDELIARSIEIFPEAGFLV